MMRRFLTLIIVLCCVFLMAGCDRGEITEKIDKTKTQLTVYNFDGGIGTDWLYTIKKMFEEQYADKSFEEGKVGAQIFVIPQKTNGYGLISTFAGSTYDVMFNEYLRYNDYLSQGILLDITEWVTTSVDGEEKDIESKLRPEQIEFLTAYDGKYYGLPHYEVYQGLIYDIDLFESKKFFFSDNPNNGNNGFIISKTEKRSCGPDGIYGTDDDGLPSSYEEFFKLCDYIVLKGCTPFVWTGQYSEYTEYLLNALVTNFSGKENAMYDYTLDSHGKEVDIITGFDGDEPIIEQVVITPDNAYLLKQQPAKYYAITFLEKIMSNSSYYYPFSRNNLTFSHTDAQEKFIFSSLENEPIAMLIEGTWWENEAISSGAIARSINTYGERAQNRKYGFMPLPRLVKGRVTEGNGSKSVFSDYINAYCVVNANIDPDKIELAKKFVQFCYSDLGLQTFTVETGIAKGINYSLTEDQFSKLSPFAQSVWKLRENADIVFPHSSTPLFINNERVLTTNVWETTINNQSFVITYDAIKSNYGAKEIFDGMKINFATWQTRYGKWFE